MASLRAFERELKVATAGLEPQAINKLLAQTAHQALEEAQSAGEAPESFIRYVNGREGVAEESVEAPGPIVYVFSWLNEVAEYALAFAEARSPVLSGRYKSSWFAMVNGALWERGTLIAASAELIVTNDQPYHRKIDTGHMRMSVPPGIVEDARQAVMRRFGNVIQAQRRVITLGGAYVLAGVFHQGYRPHARTRLQKDTAAGRELNYPALVISQRF
jgi:hypothetical protein